MDWLIVEVVLGLSFLFFLLSILASAVNEAIAGLLRLRAGTLEKGISNLLTGSTHPSDDGIELVRQLYSHPLINGYSRDKGKPSYLPSRSFRNALLDVTGLLEMAGEPSDDPEGADAVRSEVEERIGAIPDAVVRGSLTTIWRSVHRDVSEFQIGVERWFDRSMERVSGWYKRRAQLTLFVIGLLVSIAINASALNAADRLWKDGGFRKGLIAQVESQQQELSGTEVLNRLEELRFPIGWEDSNRPGNLQGWVLAAIGWLLTAFAITLGAPFWFDLLGKVSNLRAAGIKPDSVLTPAPSKGG